MSRNNTGNPIGSKAFPDFEDNVKNFDQWSISEADSFKDRKGEERLTLRGTERAGAGDTSIAVDAAARAVGAAGRAEAAEAIVDAANIKAEVDRAELAANNAFINANVYATRAEGRAATQAGEQFQVLVGNEFIRYRSFGSASSEEVGRYPAAAAVAAKADLNQVHATVYMLPQNIRVDTVAKTVTFTGYVRQGNTKRVLNSVSLNYSNPVGGNLQLILCNMTTGSLSMVGVAVDIPADCAVIGGMIANTNELLGFPDGYTRDGHGRALLAKADLNQVHATVYMLPENLRVDTVARTVTFTGYVRQGNTMRTAINTVLDYSAPVGGALQLILWDMGPGGLPSMIGISGIIPEGHAVVGSILTTTGDLSGFHMGYMKDGEKVSGGGGVGAGDSSRPPLVWDIAGYYQAPPMPGYIDGTLALIKSAEIYGWYDDLVATYPEYITRTLLGNEATGLPIYEYRFAPPMAWEQNGTTRNVRVMLQGGIHPEPVSYIYPYQFMRLICEEWEESKHLEALRWGVEFAVIPALAPWNIDNRSRVNSNGVDINRNYPARWSLTPTSGPAPLSEVETQCSATLLNSFKPDIFIDCHQFDAHPHNSFIWAPSDNEKYRMTARSLISLLSRRWQQENAWVPDAEGLGRVSGITSATASMYGTSRGVISGTFEVCLRIMQEPDGERGSPLTIRYSVDALANLVLALLRGLS